MKTRREFVKFVGGAAIGTAAILAAGPVRKAVAAPAKGVPSDPVKIGVIPILTGIAGVPGTAGLRGTQIWTDKINADSKAAIDKARSDYKMALKKAQADSKASLNQIKAAIDSKSK